MGYQGSSPPQNSLSLKSDRVRKDLMLMMMPNYLQGHAQTLNSPGGSNSGDSETETSQDEIIGLPVDVKKYTDSSIMEPGSIFDSIKPSRSELGKSSHLQLKSNILTRGNSKRQTGVTVDQRVS